jgi:hypothetical protein
MKLLYPLITTSMVLVSQTGFSQRIFDTSQVTKETIEEAPCYELPEIDKDKIQIDRNGETSYAYHYRYLKRQKFTFLVFNFRGEKVYEKAYEKAEPLKQLFTWYTSKGPLDKFWLGIENFRADFELVECAKVD